MLCMVVNDFDQYIIKAYLLSTYSRLHLTIVGFDKCFEDFAQDFQDIGLKYSYFEGTMRTKVD